jgi:hypothetical protein
MSRQSTSSEGALQSYTHDCIHCRIKLYEYALPSVASPVCNWPPEVSLVDSVLHCHSYQDLHTLAEMHVHTHTNAHTHGAGAITHVRPQIHVELLFSREQGLRLQASALRELQ